MRDQFSRTELLLGKEAMERLEKSRVIVFGIGGVGGYTVEALVRSGLGKIDLVDDDVVCMSNLNRQIIATRMTLGMSKVDAAEARILSINPDVQVTKWKMFYLPETADQFDFTQYDYIVDAVDTVSAKLSLAERARECGTPIISAMGAGNKLDPTRLEVADISQTSVDPLARVMRQQLRKRGIDHLKVVYSRETPLTPGKEGPVPGQQSCEGQTGVKAESVQRRSIPGSTAFVPSVAGLIIAGEVIRDLIRDRDKGQ